MTPLEKLEKEIHGKGNPTHPFLHKNYSLNLGIPCQDFTDFIAERLRENDTFSITELIKKVCPVISTNELKEKIDKIINFPFEKYLVFCQPKGYRELKAMYIRWQIPYAGQHRKSFYLARALCCYKVYWLPSLNGSNHNLNLAENDSYIPFSKTNDTCLLMRKISIGARLHLLSALEWPSKNRQLPYQADFDLRALGIDVQDTTREILESGLFTYPNSVEPLLPSMLKLHLIRECETEGANYHKSWRKIDLAISLASTNPDRFQELIQEFVIAVPNDKYKDDLNDILFFSKALEQIFRLLDMRQEIDNENSFTR